MSTLMDITVKANNKRQVSSLEPPSKRLSMFSTSDMQDENSHFIDTDPIKPHFMASTSASMARVTTPQSLSRPSTPGSLDSGSSRPSGWMASAGRRFGITTPKSRKLSKATGLKKVSPKAAKMKTQSKKQLAQVSPPTIQRPALPRRGSPPDKPLPSLPVATFVTKSPVHRRSLIDATEVPLRRSVSPSPGLQIVQDWPALSPERPTLTTQVSNTPQPDPEKSSSATAGLDEIKEKDSSASPPVPSEGDDSVLSPAHHQATTSCYPAPSPTPSPDTYAIASSNNPTPHKRNSLSASKIPQAKTSVIRARLPVAAAGFKDGGIGATINSKIASRDDGALLPSRSTATPDSRLSKLGPIRTHSRSRRMVTSQGSPYSTGIRPHAAKLLEIKKRLEKNRRSPLVFEGEPSLVAADHTESSDSAEVAAVKEYCSVNTSDRRSSIPLPSRLIHELPEGDTDCEVLMAKPEKKAETDIETNDHESADGDVDTEVEDRVTALPALKAPATTATISNTTQYRSVSTTPALVTPDRLELGLSGDEDSDSDIGSLHSFGDFDPAGYRVRRLSTMSPKDGPVLKVSDAADAVIFGPPQKRDVSTLACNDSRRSSALDLRRSLVIREALRKTKEGVKAHLPSSMTTRSLSNEGGNDDGDEISVKEIYGPQPSPAAAENSLCPKATADPLATVVKDFDALRIISDSYTTSKHSKADSDASTHGIFNSNESRWPLKEPMSTAAELEIVNDLPAEEESSWISPLSNNQWNHNTRSDEILPTPEAPAHPKSPTSRSKAYARLPTVYAQKHLSPADRKDSPFDAASDRSSASIPIRASIAVHPPRSSSKYQTRTWSTSTHVSSGTAAQQKTPIPNRFISPMSSPQAKEVMSHYRKKSSCDAVIRSLDNRLDALDNKSKYDPTSPVSKASPAELTSSSKSVLSNFRGLFHKRSTEPGVLSGSRSTPSSHRRKNVRNSKDGSPFPYISSPVPTVSHQEAAQCAIETHHQAAANSRAADLAHQDHLAHLITKKEDGQVETDEMQKATRLAFDVLDLAKSETATVKKGLLVDLGRTMVQTVTASRDAEKAMEEAKQAAARAEIAALTARQNVQEMAAIVQGVVGGSRWV